MKIFSIIFILLSFFQVGCTTCRESLQKKYSNKKFIIADGISSSQEEAKDAAFSGIAKFFKTRVKSLAYRGSKRNKTQKSSVEKFRELITTTDLNIQGVEIVGVCFDDDVDKYVALAILSKSMYYHHLTSEIEPQQTAYLKLVTSYHSLKRSKDIDTALVKLREALKEKQKVDLELLQLQAMGFPVSKYFSNYDQLYATEKDEAGKLQYCIDSHSHNKHLIPFIKNVLDVKNIRFRVATGCQRHVEVTQTITRGNRFQGSIILKGIVDIRIIGASGRAVDTFHYTASGLGHNIAEAKDSLHQNFLKNVN